LEGYISATALMKAYTRILAGDEKIKVRCDSILFQWTEFDIYLAKR
jgi:hypothetical protein